MKKRTKIIILISVAFVIVAMLATTSFFVINYIQEQRYMLEELQEENKKLKDKTSIEETTEEATTENDDPYYFYSVSDLLIAIKKNPNFYKYQTVRVYGYFKDYETYDGKYSAYLRSENPYSTIEIYVKSGSRYLLDDGDYILAKATVSIIDGEIILSGMEYTLIETALEREQNGG